MSLEQQTSAVTKLRESMHSLSQFSLLVPMVLVSGQPAHSPSENSPWHRPVRS